MRAEECPKWETCSAPICPLNFLKDSVWCPSDEVCKSRDYSNLDWIKDQKKIAKKAKDRSKYFTFQMLNRNCRITKGIIGQEQENEGPQLKKWLALHPTMKKMSLAQRKAVGERLKKYRQLKGK